MGNAAKYKFSQEEESKTTLDAGMNLDYLPGHKLESLLIDFDLYT
jgi:hypothetical protein